VRFQEEIKNNPAHVHRYDFQDVREALSKQPKEQKRIKKNSSTKKVYPPSRTVELDNIIDLFFNF